MQTRYRAPAALALSALFVACAAPAQEAERPRKYFDKISFEGGVAPMESGDARTYLSSASQDKQGPVASYASYSTRVGKIGLEIQYPDLRKGDLVPFCGEVYRVEAISTGEGRCMTLGRLPIDKRPRGIAPAQDSLTVPLRKGRWGLGTWGYEPGVRWYVFVLEAKAPAKEGGKATARVGVRHEDERVPSEAEVSAGDVLLIGKHAHRVRAVVPPDEKERLIGWVEFDPEAVAEKDLVARKTPFVRPARPKKE